MVNSPALDRRLELQAIFLGMTPNVYHQPPVNVEMKYPCIKYERDDIDIKYADNSPYYNTTRYQVTVIDKDSDSNIPEKIAALPMCRFNRHYTADNLNHDVFNLFF